MVSYLKLTSERIGGISRDLTLPIRPDGNTRVSALSPLPFIHGPSPLQHLGYSNRDSSDPTDDFGITGEAYVSNSAVGLRGRNKEKASFSDFAPGTDVAVAEFNKEDRPVEFVGPDTAVDFSLSSVNFDERTRTNPGKECAFWMTSRLSAKSDALP